MKHFCLVCNYSGLYDEPYTNGIASDEICPCCGFQYGFDDFDRGEDVYEEWRNSWIENGCKWFSRGRKAPANWDVKEQLKVFNKKK